MSQKIYPNDRCPCKSGKKYKNCCGKAENKYTKDFIENHRSNQRLEDFVLKRVREDSAFLTVALNKIIGSEGYKFCKDNKESLEEEYQKDSLKSYVKDDPLKLMDKAKEIEYKDIRKKVRPYYEEKSEDIISLNKKNKICKAGRQVELFHAYLMNNLLQRFDDYCYIPSDDVIKEGQFPGFFAHRGYDFLVAMTLYLELQLGVHIYLGEAPFDKERDEGDYGYSYIKDKLGCKDEGEIDSGILGVSRFISDYIKMINNNTKDYNVMRIVDMYKDIGAYGKHNDNLDDIKVTDEYNKLSTLEQLNWWYQLKEYKKDAYSAAIENIKDIYIKAQESEADFALNYEKYLSALVIGLCLNDIGYQWEALAYFPQSDVMKYIFGVKCAVLYFEGRNNPNIITLEFPDYMLGVDDANEIHAGKIDLYYFYQLAVRLLLDEKNGVFNSFNGPIYVDFDTDPNSGEFVFRTRDIDDDEFSEEHSKVSPAKKSPRIAPPMGKLKIRLYDFFNGYSFYLEDKEKKVIGSYPMLPWVINKKDDNIEYDLPFVVPDVENNYKNLYSNEIGKRQEFLSMKFWLTREIPANCLEEFLNPAIILSWEQLKKTMKELEKTNEELEKTNAELLKEKERLEKQKKRNRNLVRNITHSASNYLIPDKLSDMGDKLHQAIEGALSLTEIDPEVLIQQSQDEDYLLRQLKTLALQHTADTESLITNIKNGLTEDKDRGYVIDLPITYALKTLLKRILYKGDDRSFFIRKKINIEEELGKTKEFKEILSDETITPIIAWWEKNIGGKIQIEISEIWKSIYIIKDAGFYDLIVRIMIELFLNFLSHGDVKKGLILELGQEGCIAGDITKPIWAFIACKNYIGEHYEYGDNDGIETLCSVIEQINGKEDDTEKGGVDNKLDNERGIYECKVWLSANLLKIKKKK